MIIAHFQTAAKQLFTHKGKSILTVLGIVIAISSVIIIISLGSVLRNYLNSEVSVFGTNFINAWIPYEKSNDISITPDDYEKLKASTILEEITALNAVFQKSTFLKYRDDQYRLWLSGVYPEKFSFTTFKNPRYGRYFDSSHVSNAEKVLVIEEHCAKMIFNSAETAVNKKVTINNQTFIIIGVAPNSPFIGPRQSCNSFAPITTTQEVVGSDEHKTIDYIDIEFSRQADADLVTEKIRHEIMQIKNISADDVEVYSVEYQLQTIDSILYGIQLFITAIAAISLLVGGIGIMNIMLVTVKERTKEIGTRKALGANKRSILFQFLIEAIILTTIGGIIGIIIGTIVTILLIQLANFIQTDFHLTFIFVPSAYALACLVSILTGIIFGLYPAWKAARLQPTEALRYE